MNLFKYFKKIILLIAIKDKSSSCSVSSSIDIANIITKSIENTDSQIIQNQTIEEKILEDQQICKIFDFYDKPDNSKVGIENDFERICKYKDKYENLKNRFKGKNASFT